jgi:RND family efflux transporter MFP subunit
MMRPAYLALCLALPIFVAASEEAPAGSVLVTTVALKRQALAETLSGYGVVAPDTRNTQTVSLGRAGRIERMLVSVGQVVRKGTPLFEFDTAADVTAGYQQAQQAVTFSRGEVARLESMVAQQLATQSQLAAAKRDLAAAESNLQAAQREGAQQGLATVAAPFDGFVSAIQVAQGDRLASGAAVLQLARGGAQHVALGVEPEDALRVHAGQTVSLASVLNAARTANGRISQVAGAINPQTQMVDVQVELPQGGFISGTRVRGDIRLAAQEGWVVPRSAVLSDEEGDYLFQVSAEHAHRVVVQKGVEQDGLVAVQGKFDAKAPVVSVGNYELEDGMTVRSGGR